MFDLTYQITPRAVTISASRLQTPQPRTPIMANPVIVFGPTGNIARVASTTAHERGATVYLAMRNPNKPIPGLSQDAESSGRYTRLQADLHQPDTVATAVKASGAKRAFIYVAHGSKDHMNATLLALKDSGITFVVFLGSFTVTDPASEMDASDPIAYVHAQVEVNLENIFGRGSYCAIRPGSFITNSLGWKAGIQAGHLELFGLNFKMDCITPEDMGRVSGAILAASPDQPIDHAVYLYGPQLVSQRDVVTTIARVLDKEVVVQGQTPEEATSAMIKAGIPPRIVQWTVGRRTDDNTAAVVRPEYEQGWRNVEKYTGKPAMGHEDWIKANQDLFV
jgi:hypothetical protein